jgi:hypothetical protein
LLAIKTEIDRPPAVGASLLAINPEIDRSTTVVCPTLDQPATPPRADREQARSYGLNASLADRLRVASARRLRGGAVAAHIKPAPRARVLLVCPFRLLRNQVLQRPAPVPGSLPATVCPWCRVSSRRSGKPTRADGHRHGRCPVSISDYVLAGLLEAVDRASTRSWGARYECGCGSIRTWSTRTTRITEGAIVYPTHRHLHRASSLSLWGRRVGPSPAIDEANQ